MRSADTSPEVYRKHIQVYRAVDPARKVELAVQMSEEMWEIAAEGIRARHPEYDDDAVMWAVRRMRVGDDLFREVWPAAPVVAP